MLLRLTWSESSVVEGGAVSTGRSETLLHRWLEKVKDIRKQKDREESVIVRACERDIENAWMDRRWRGEEDQASNKG